MSEIMFCQLDNNIEFLAKKKNFDQLRERMLISEYFFWMCSKNSVFISSSLIETRKTLEMLLTLFLEENNINNKPKESLFKLEEKIVNLFPNIKGYIDIIRIKGNDSAHIKNDKFLPKDVNECLDNLTKIFNEYVGLQDDARLSYSFSSDRATEFYETSEFFILDVRKKELDELKNRLEAAQQDSKNNKEEITLLKSELKRIEKENSNLIKTIRQVSSELEVANKKIDSLKEDNLRIKKLLIASVVVLGTAAVAATTAAVVMAVKTKRPGKHKKIG